MFRKLVLLMLGLSLMLTACGKPNVENEALTHIRLPMGYIPNIQYAPFYVTVEKGYFKDAGIEIEFDYKFETDGVALVAAGELPFAVVSGEQVLLARAQGLPVTYVAAWYQQYPVSVVAKSEANVLVPQDLKGKKIGLPGLFGASYIGLRALLAAGKLTEADVTLDAIGFNQVELMAAGQQDIVVGYAANEPLQLRAQGIAVTELRVADYAQLAANGLLASEKVIAENPELARAFVDAFLKGLQYTIDRPDEAFEISKAYIPNFSELDADVQKQVLEVSIEQWKAERLGYSDPQAWENMQNVLLEMGLIAEPLDLSKAFTNEFVP
ncbi:MAG: ABC transporter substrate-binding protein [Anaerolineae bacterium]|jgi:NitT/TauT family transport system substrate-binding protein|nr:ABC transporter substrate-binding protein [Anaerolineae bacterium]MBL8103923.1 ABC transporter substrate-binding protein [Anaerolineales bacterium]MCC7188810.1 ABC transporter substrate-binding protein [Anaerolineales bacterium]